MKSCTRRAARSSATARSCRAAAKLPVPAKDDLTFKPKSAWKFVGKERQIYDLKDITTGKAAFGLDIYREGMVFASIEHPPVLGGTVKTLDDKDALTVKGVSADGDARHAQAARAVPAARRRRRHRQQHVGGAAGPQEAEDRLERRPARQLQQRAVQAGDDRAREAAAEGRAQSRQRGRRVRERRQGHRGDVLHADGGARGDGAAGGGRGVQERQGRSVDADAESSGRAGHRRRGRRRRQEERRLPRDAARRRLRQKEQARLRGRSGGPLEETRQAGEGHLDARRRHPFRLLPHDGGGLSQGHRRREGQADRVAAAIGLPADRVDVRIARAARLRARHGPRRHALRRAEHPRRKRRRRRARPHRLVPRRHEQLPRVRGAQLRRRDGARGRPRHARVPARHDRSGQGDRPQGAGRGLLELRRADRQVPGRQPASAARARSRRREIQLGQAQARQRLGHRHRRAPQLQHLRRVGRRGGSRRAGTRAHSAHRSGGRRGRRHQPRSRPRAVRGRRP